MTLTEFFAARVTEDEECARLCVDIGQDWVAYGIQPVGMSGKRVLAECEAKRRIVELHFENDPGPDAECGACGDIGGYYSQVWPCPTIKALAAVYADHPDYDEAWRP